jgi:predicted regulator of amino acid metabolism with ACT domain
MKVAITLICMALFGIQSSKELKKYFSNLTSTAILTHNDESVGYPTIVVCSKQGYKKSQFSQTLEMFDKNAYSYQDIFFNGSFYPENMTNVMVIHTFNRVRCFKA